MSVIHGANYGTPTLDLNFAKNKSLIDTVSGRNYVTFSRAQANYLTTYVGADGLIKTASADEPRFDHNPLTGECLGLLIEEQRSNRVSYSVISSTGWSAVDGATITSNQAIAPDGSLTAALITFPGISVPRISSFTQFASGNHTISVWIKAKTGTVTIRIGNGNDYGVDQTVGTTWTRISYVSSAGSNSAGIYCSSSFSPAEFYAWGFQEEAGSFATSLIPTSGSTVTRSADVMSITGTNFSRWYNQSEGTMFVNARMQFQPSVSGQFPDIYTTGSYPDRLWSLYLLNGLNNLVIGTDTHTQSLQTLSTSPQTFKVAQALSNTSLAWSASKDGGSIFSGSLSKSITNTSSISFGGSSGAVRQISRLTYYPTRLQNYQLQQLTK